MDEINVEIENALNISQDKFLQTIESHVRSGNRITESVVMACEDMDLDIDYGATLLTPEFIEKIRSDAEDLHLLKKDPREGFNV